MKKVEEKKNKTFLEKITLGFKNIILSNIVLNVLFLILGVLMYLNVGITEQLAGIFIGIFFIIFGIFYVYEFLLRRENPIFSLEIILGIIAFILGIFIIVDPFKITRLLTFVLGIYLIVQATLKIVDAFRLRKLKFDGWSILLVTSIITLVFGIFVTVNPMRAYYVIEVAALFIILSSILTISNLIMLYTKAKEIESIFKK